jgi:gliding motility-associated-like protein
MIESFLIFDRWGTQIFEQQNFFPNDPANGWDGTYRGEKLNPAVFVYQAKVKFIDGQTLLFKGDITLIR